MLFEFGEYRYVDREQGTSEYGIDRAVHGGRKTVPRPARDVGEEMVVCECSGVGTEFMIIVTSSVVEPSINKPNSVLMSGQTIQSTSNMNYYMLF